MTISMSNTTRADSRLPMRREARIVTVGVLTLAMLVGACSGPDAAQASGKASGQQDAAADAGSDGPPPGQSGAPALPPSPGEPPADRSAVISMEERADKFPGRAPATGCFITFAYRGLAPETLIWDNEPCTDLTARFVGRAELERDDDWARLDPAQQADVAQLPEGKVLYVAGAFTASVYPLGLNGLTYEVTVSD